MFKKPTHISAPIQPVEPINPLKRAAPLPIINTASGLQLEIKPSKKPKKIILFAGLGLVVLIIASLLGGVIWYQTQLRPADSSSEALRKITIESGTGPKAIAKQLKEDGVIRNEEAFSLYTRISRTQNKLQAGTYRLSPSESTQEIVKHLVDGTVDTFSIRFLPGSTLAENRSVLIKAGYSAKELDAALLGSYSSSLFEGKPSGSDLEGYIYGETYNFSSNATVEDILNRTFAQYDQVIKENDLVAKFKAQGLTLYQGITLASIVQREAIGGDEADIAQVFYNRLANGTMLGSDVTYQYAADKMGVPRDTNLDSPYNTRRYTGLPPGPISAPGKAALIGTANPSGHNYLFFLSGDDDKTYFSTDLAGHEANIKAHCQVKCSIL
ncbi:endolytic transglycosylase MltG [Candidatus Saccharibacteria bacterium]|nr:endolytic transglycosylase MltG [Candidatus Saccharibacteria bacterium]